MSLQEKPWRIQDSLDKSVEEIEAFRARGGFVGRLQISPERYTTFSQTYRVRLDRSKSHNTQWLFLAAEHVHNWRGLNWRNVRTMELVPEPHNGYDPTAVGVYVHGRRIGYVGGDSAIFDIVCAHNAQGRAVIVGGSLHNVPQVHLPWDVFTHGMYKASGLQLDAKKLAKRVVKDVIPDFLERTMADISETEATAFKRYSHLLPAVYWPENHPRFTEGVTENGFDIGGKGYVPLCVQNELLNLREQHQEKVKAKRREVRRHAAEQRRREIDNRRLESQIRRERRRERDADIVERSAGGEDLSEIAKSLGLTRGTVRTVAVAAGVPVPKIDPGFNETNLSAAVRRAERSIRAAELQNERGSRAEVAAKLGVSVAAVKLLLRDGRFYVAPESSPERLLETLNVTEDGRAQDKLTKRRRRDKKVLMELRPDLFA